MKSPGRFPNDRGSSEIEHAWDANPRQQLQGAWKSRLTPNRWGGGRRFHQCPYRHAASAGFKENNDFADAEN